MKNYYNDTDEKLFLIEGPITEFKMTSKLLDLIKEMTPWMRMGNKAAGIVGVLTQSASLVGGAVMASRYSELVQVITCRIGEQEVTGEFSGADLLHNGDAVKAVVAKRGDTLYVHAIVRPQDELLWLPVAANEGRKALFKANMNFFWFLYLGVLTMVAIIDVFIGGIREAVTSLPISVVGGFLIFAPIMLWVTKDVWPLAIRAEQIFTVLGFPDVEKLNMRRGYFKWFHVQSTRDLNYYESVFYYQRVLEAHRTGTKVKKEKLPDPPEWHAYKSLAEDEAEHAQFLETKAQYAEQYRQRHRGKQAKRNAHKPTHFPNK